MTSNEETISPLKQANVPLTISEQFASAPPVPSGSSSGIIVTSKSTSASAKYCLIISILYPPATITSSTKSLGTPSTTLSSSVLSSIGNNGLGIWLVQGRNLEPTPPAKTTTCMALPQCFNLSINPIHALHKCHCRIKVFKDGLQLALLGESHEYPRVPRQSNAKRVRSTCIRRRTLYFSRTSASRLRQSQFEGCSSKVSDSCWWKRKRDTV